MNVIYPINSINFKAICKGQYQNLKDISVANGLDIQKADEFESKIQKLFPDNTKTLKFNIIGTPLNFNEVSIHLSDRSGKVLQQVTGRVLPNDIKYFEKNEVRESNAQVFEKTFNLVKKLKTSFDSMLKQEKAEEESKKRLKTYSRSSIDFKCLISPDVDIIKNTSINAGYPKEKADEIHKLIKKKFSDDSYKLMVFNLRLDETIDKKGNRQYIIYHSLNPFSDAVPNKNSHPPGTNSTIISKGTTTEDRKNLFENLYKVIKQYY